LATEAALRNETQWERKKKTDDAADPATAQASPAEEANPE
jgi:hypothetical protein